MNPNTNTNTIYFNGNEIIIRGSPQRITIDSDNNRIELLPLVVDAHVPAPILIPNMPFIDETELFRKHLFGSKLIQCKHNGAVVECTNFASLFMYMFRSMTATQRQAYFENIQNHTVIQEECNERGYKYYPDIGVSIRNENAPITLHNVVRIIHITRRPIELHIRLRNNEIVHFRKA